MSKASEWAKKAESDALPELEFEIDDIRFTVDNLGNLEIINETHGRHGGVYLTVRPRTALKFARWILATFGEDSASRPA